MNLASDCSSGKQKSLNSLRQWQLIFEHCSLELFRLSDSLGSGSHVQYHSINHSGSNLWNYLDYRIHWEVEAMSGITASNMVVGTYAYGYYIQQGMNPYRYLTCCVPSNFYNVFWFSFKISRSHSRYLEARPMFKVWWLPITWHLS